MWPRKKQFHHSFLAFLPQIEPLPVTQENGWIAFIGPGDADGNRDLGLVRPDGSDRRVVTSIDLLAGVDWSPDGERFVFEQGRNGKHELVVMDVHGRATRTLDAPLDYIHSLGWSPDGNRLAFGTSVKSNDVNTDRPRDLYVVDADGMSEGRRLTSAPAGAAAPSWSPDGCWISFVRAGDAMAVNVETAEERVLVPNGKYPVWSPNGEWIAFQRGDALWLARSDNTEQTQLTGGADWWWPGCWAPDGTSLLAYRPVGVKQVRFDNFVINTTEARPAPTGVHSWSPDGTMFLGWEGTDTFVVNEDGTGRVNVAHCDATYHSAREAWWLPG